MIATLRAIWQADSAFPSGSFAFSGGLEAFCAMTPASDAVAFSPVLHDILARRWATAERVMLATAHRAGGDMNKIAAADAEWEAATLIEPLRDGSRRNGTALVAAHARLGTTMAIRLRTACHNSVCLGHLAVMQGALFRALGMELDVAIAAAGYATAAALASAAVRLGRIGTIEAQRALGAVLPLLADIAAHPPPPDAVPESFLPLLDIAAARHARAPMRLFAT